MLAKVTGVQTFSTVATRRKGLNKLRESIPNPHHSLLDIRYDDRIEAAIAKMEQLLPDARISKRSLALMLIGGDASLKNWLHSVIDDSRIDQLETVVKETQSGVSEPLGYVINKERQKIVNEVVSSCQTKVEKAEKGIKQWLGMATMHPVWGLPFLLVILYLVYEFVGVLGAGVMVDFMEETVFGELINPYVIKFIDTVMPAAFLKGCSSASTA
jgi:ferrous iron transport protein B